ncbi:MAG: RNB domain-containing ribonuclease, partial [Patulibacter minatonensis]
MTVRRILSPSGAEHADALRAGFAALTAELELPAEFEPEVLGEIAAASAEGAPAALAAGLIGAAEREDARALPLVTLDPAGSRDLDQAFAIEPGSAPGTTVLHYAIADVAAHVVPGGAVEAESLRRGETVYLPGRRVPLHPPQLSEDVASLLPGEERLAVLWTLTVDSQGELTGVPQVRRALVRSTAQLDYASAQAALVAGRPHPQIAALAELGPALQAAAVRRGAIELPEPEQELVETAGGGWALAWAPRAPLEGWNAQLSLSTGRAAAGLM